MDKELQIIGWVKSDIASRADAPKMETEDAPEATVTVEPVFAEALDGLKVGQDVLIVTWLHQSDRAVTKVHPRGNQDNPMRGVFATRSPDRPNPLGVHHTTIVAFETPTKLRLSRLEALDGTPVVDIKPVAPHQHQAGQAGRAEAEAPAATEDWGDSIPDEVGDAISTTCYRAWQRGLLSGVSGNVSVRLGNAMVVTCSGTAKGYLGPGDLTAIDMRSGKRLDQGRPSTESQAHLEIYDVQPDAWAIVHTHPPHLLALSLCVDEAQLLDLPLFEAEVLRKNLAQVPDLQPGSQVLAKAIAAAAKGCHAVFMRRHGLICWGKSLQEALAWTEEVEHLARIQLAALGKDSPIARFMNGTSASS